MKKSILFFMFFLLFGSLNLSAQINSEAIEIKKNKYLINEQVLMPKDLLSITESNTQAYDFMKKAKSNYDAASVFSFAGGFLIGYPIGMAIGGGDPEWAMAAVGAGLSLISIPFIISYHKNAKKAIGIYNKDLPQTQNSRSFSFELQPKVNGVGLVMKF